jgi:hypothetical protein
MTTLHETDFSAWLQSQIDCIRRRDFEYLDIINLLEEMEDLGGSFKDALESHLTNLIMHLLKDKYQPDMSCNSWNASIANARTCIKRIIRKNPSLKNYPDSVLRECYSTSMKAAIKESGLKSGVFPSQCPWTMHEILGK